MILYSISVYTQETNNNTLKEKMDNYTKTVKMKWEFNPLKNYETDRYFSGWTDPNAYSTKFWIGEVLNAKEMYPNPNFNFDKIDFFITLPLQQR